jgi:ubiquinol-cytochrome c reductase cytochrome b subunit
MLGGPIIAGETLSRFFAIHVFIVPGTLIAFVGVHLLMVLKLGVNEWPMPGRVVKRSTYLKEYHELTHDKDGVPFVPDAFRKDFVFSGIIILALVACAAFFGPFGPKGQPDPTIVQTVPRPDYFFLWAYAALALLPPNLETVLLLVAPAIVIGFLIALPLISGTGEKHWRRRPIAVLVVLLMIISLAAFTKLGTYAPWSPVMDAWSSAPVPQKLLEGRSALERQGAVVFQAKQCRNCHALGNEGGQRGPALDAVATRLTGDELIRQVLQGRGNMPAYGKNLSPAETTALVAFLKSLHPADQAPARDATLLSVNAVARTPR